MHIVVIPSLEHFNQESYYKEVEKILKEQPGLTADRLATLMRVNVVLMKE